MCSGSAYPIFSSKKLPTGGRDVRGDIVQAPVPRRPRAPTSTRFVHSRCEATSSAPHDTLLPAGLHADVGGMAADGTGTDTVAVLALPGQSRTTGGGVRAALPRRRPHRSAGPIASNDPVAGSRSLV